MLKAGMSSLRVKRTTDFRADPSERQRLTRFQNTDRRVAQPREYVPPLLSFRSIAPRRPGRQDDLSPRGRSLRGRQERHKPERRAPFLSEPGGRPRRSPLWRASDRQEGTQDVRSRRGSFV